MKAKIDLEKFICSYIKWNNIQDALKDQGLKCWNGEIVEIPQESEEDDETIKKAIIKFLIDVNNGAYTKSESEIASWIAWLESNGEQYNNEDLNILQRFSFYSYKDEPNILYLSGLYVNEKCRNKGIGTKILEVADEVAKSLNCHAIRLKTKIGSNAERLYRRNEYNTLKREGNQVWLEKQGEQKPYGQRKECFYCQFNYAGECKGYCSMKQGEQKPAVDFKAEDWYVSKVDGKIHNIYNSGVEPNFKVGDWIIATDNEGNITIEKIIEFWGDKVRLVDTDGYYTLWPQHELNYYHLWTIQDAKDGDVLVEDSCIFIIQKLGDNSSAAKTYCTLYNDGDFDDGSILYFDVDSTKPATKEQREFLFSKMKEEGWEWDTDKKELRKIEKAR